MTFWMDLLLDADFNVEIEQDFTLKIIQQKTEGNAELDVAHLSGGERTALALCLRLSLNDVISQEQETRLIILDEPTKGFSSKQMEKMSDPLAQLPCEQIIIVSHEPVVESLAQHIIRISKEHGISSIER